MNWFTSGFYSRWIKTLPITDISGELHALHEEYYQLRNQHLNAETLEDFMILRQIMQNFCHFRRNSKNNISFKISKILN